MKQDFVKPRLVGRRFDEHTLPLEILKDFAAFEEMLVEVAKREYLRANPDRVRTPKGFTKGVELHLEKVDEGSAIATIALVFYALLPPADAQYYEQARGQIVETIAGVGSGRPLALGRDVLRYFDRFGRGLREGESIEFERQNGQIASLTPRVREQLMLASQAEEWTEDATLRGCIPEVDQADHTFELELRDGTKLKAPLLEQHLQSVLDAHVGYRERALVAIKGVIKRDRADHLKGFESVEHITPLDPLDIEARLEVLAQLQDGWLDGKGRALDRDALRSLAQDFEQYFDPNLPLPYLYPTAEGGVQAEWALRDWEVSLDIELPSKMAQYQALNLRTRVSKDFDFELSQGEGTWTALNDALKALQEDQA